MTANDSIKRIWHRSGLYFKRKGPAILSILGSVGVVTTTAIAIKKAPKATEKISDLEKKKGGKLSIFETTLAVAPDYAPVLASGIASIACILCANSLNEKKQSNLASAYILSSNTFNEYRKTLICLHGEEADEEVINEIVRRRADLCVLDLELSEDKLLFYEPISNTMFARCEREVMDAEYHLNRNFALRGCASLNEFYQFLGLPETEEGEAIGWSMSSGISWVDFEHSPKTKEDGTVYYVINTVFPPDENYFDDWL